MKCPKGKESNIIVIPEGNVYYITLLPFTEILSFIIWSSKGNVILSLPVLLLFGMKLIAYCIEELYTMTNYILYLFVLPCTQWFHVHSVLDSEFVVKQIF